LAPVTGEGTSETPLKDPADEPTLHGLFREFLLIGATSLGGGRSTYFQDAFVRRRKWITDEEFLEAVAVSQILPGPNIGNLAAYLGQRLGGALGAAIAVVCLTLPGAISILAVAWLYFNGMPASVTEPIGRGVSAAAVGLAAAAVWRLRGGAGNPLAYAVTAVTFILFGPLHWPILAVLGTCLPLSFLAVRFGRR
jgi:chromate transporter